MPKFRFYCSTWAPGRGHKDMRYLMTGQTMEDALSRLEAALQKRHPGIIINAKLWEKVED